MNLEFKNEEVKARYECLVEKDRDVQKAGVYQGLLSNIHLGMAAAMVRQGSNLIKERENVAPPLSVEEKTKLINEATTVEAVDQLMQGETRKPLLKVAEARKQALTV